METLFLLASTFLVQAHLLGLFLEPRLICGSLFFSHSPSGENLTKAICVVLSIREPGHIPESCFISMPLGGNHTHASDFSTAAATAIAEGSMVALASQSAQHNNCECSKPGPICFFLY
ncbi:MAG: hypothetical protein BYD32DRAFT_231165 [Podila humilis]|nr:MAG: hypothetical protein BYD32DRAFT_231165 [Podila humilis]